MPRQPYAAQILLDEVRAEFPDAELEPFGDPDGLGVWREFRFDKDTSEELADALELLEDRRVHSVNLTDAGYLHVTFTPRPFADERDPFGVADALEVAASESSESSGAVVE